MRPAMWSRRRGHSSATALDSRSGSGIFGSKSWRVHVFYRTLARNRFRDRMRSIYRTQGQPFSLRRCEMVCQACGSPVVEQVRFCSKCGAQVAGDVPVQPPPMYSGQPPYMYPPMYRGCSGTCRRSASLVACMRDIVCWRLDRLFFLRAFSTHGFGGRGGWMLGTQMPPMMPPVDGRDGARRCYSHGDRRGACGCSWDLACCSGSPGAGRWLSWPPSWRCSSSRSGRRWGSIRSGCWLRRPRGWSMRRSRTGVRLDGRLLV